MAYTYAWDETAPNGAAVAANTLDTIIQDLKKSIRERMNEIVTNWDVDGTQPKTVKVAGGGTNIVSYAIGDVIFASGVTTLSKLAIGTANKVLTSSGTAPQWVDSLTLGGTLGVTGATTLAAVSATTGAFSGNVTVGGTLGVTGAVTGGTYNSQTISATASFTGSVAIGTTLGVSGATTLAGLSATTGAFSGAVTMATTLAVTGAVTFSSSLAVTGALTVGGVSIVGTRTARVYRSGSNQSIAAGADTKVQFNSETSDANNLFDAVTNYRWQPNVAGKYSVKAQVSESSGDTFTGVRRILIYKNGVEYSRNQEFLGASNADIVIDDDVDMNGSTDYVEIFFWSGDAANLLLGSNLTFANFSRIGD